MPLSISPQAALPLRPLMPPPPRETFLRSRLKMRHVQLIVAIDARRSIHQAAALGMTQPAAARLLSDVGSSETPCLPSWT